jgi:hypothetical protein
MFKKKMILASSVIMTIAISACSTKSEDSPIQFSGTPPKQQSQDSGFFDPKATIAGPVIEGRWISACAQKSNGAYRKFDLKIVGETISRSEINYTDSACATAGIPNENHGRFRFIELFADGGYGIEYAFDAGSGITSFPQEKIVFKDKVIFISNFFTGDLAQVMTDEPLYLADPVTGVPVAPPVPEPVIKQAEPAYSYRDVKFAFCSIQGFGAMIDLRDVNLTRLGAGNAKMGFKSCNAMKPIKWQSTQKTVNVTSINGLPQLSFSDGSTISTNTSETGLGRTTGYSVIAGNSGDCFFLKNDGTSGLNFIYRCE